MIFPLRKGVLVKLESLNKVLTVSVTYSPLSVANIAEMVMFYSNGPAFMNFPLHEGPVSQTREFKHCFGSFYDTDSPLSVTNIAEMALFYLN